MKGAQPPLIHPPGRGFQSQGLGPPSFIIRGLCPADPLLAYSLALAPRKTRSQGSTRGARLVASTPRNGGFAPRAPCSLTRSPWLQEKARSQGSARRARLVASTP